jgi:hypothetical protein
MSNAYRHVELLTGDVSRRRWTTEQKLTILEQSFEPGETVSSTARDGVRTKCSVLMRPSQSANPRLDPVSRKGGGRVPAGDRARGGARHAVGHPQSPSRRADFNETDYARGPQRGAMTGTILSHASWPTEATLRCPVCGLRPVLAG